MGGSSFSGGAYGWWSEVGEREGLNGIVYRPSYFGIILRGNVEGEIEERLTV
jgi:hypothetical protein